MPIVKHENARSKALNAFKKYKVKYYRDNAYIFFPDPHGYFSFLPIFFVS